MSFFPLGILPVIPALPRLFSVAEPNAGGGAAGDAARSFCAVTHFLVKLG